MTNFKTLFNSIKCSTSVEVNNVLKRGHRRIYHISQAQVQKVMLFKENPF